MKFITFRKEGSPMFQQLIGTIFADYAVIIKYLLLAILATSVLTMIVKKLFKLALILALIAMAAYYIVPGIITPPPLPPIQ